MTIGKIPKEDETEGSLLARLVRASQLPAEDRAALGVYQGMTSHLRAGQPLVSKGAIVSNAHFVTSGFACRYRLLPSGGRQILAFLLPGDVCGLPRRLSEPLDHDVCALSPCTFEAFPHRRLNHLISDHPDVGDALVLVSFTEEAISREWIVNIGRRPADRRTAHLFCELLERLRVVDLVRDGSFDLPITQADLADALGLSVVHVNRTLQLLRGRNLITLSAGVLTVLDEAALQAFAEFDRGYLHLDRRGTDVSPRSAPHIPAVGLNGAARSAP